MPSAAVISRAALRAVSNNPTELGTALLETILTGLDPDELLTVVHGMLKAERAERVSKDDTRMVPDWRTREAAVRIALSYGVGLPIQRSVEITQQIEDDGQTLERMLSSPATRIALMRAIQDREAQDQVPGTRE